MHPLIADAFLEFFALLVGLIPRPDDTTPEQGKVITDPLHRLVDLLHVEAGHKRTLQHLGSFARDWLAILEPRNHNRLRRPAVDARFDHLQIRVEHLELAV